jgi:hypothetical protein
VFFFIASISIGATAKQIRKWQVAQSIREIVGLPSMIRTGDLGLRRIRGCWKVDIFQ